jgi:type IV conjugative transfer system protein TraL|tara:strand:+ start:1777 stop:2067 length:291 start_codon:yes stop_codon:yes gene_type:complete
MDFEKFYIPQFLDSELEYLHLTIREHAIIIICMGLGFSLKKFLLGTVLALALVLISKELKKRLDISVVPSFFYWHFPSWFTGIKSLPSSHKRFFVG